MAVSGRGNHPKEEEEETYQLLFFHAVSSSSFFPGAEIHSPLLFWTFLPCDWSGSLLGASASFFLSRFLLRGFVLHHLVEKRPLLKALDRASKKKTNTGEVR